MARKIYVIVVACFIVAILAIGCSNSSYPFEGQMASMKVTEPFEGQTTSTKVTEPQEFNEETTIGGDIISVDCDLIVNGKLIESKYYVALNRKNMCAELPLIAILEALDISIVWVNESTAKFTVNQIDYLLDTKAGTLYETDGNINIICASPGSTHGTYYKNTGKDFVVDSDSLSGLFEHILGVSITINFDSHIVVVGKTGDSTMS